MVSKLIKMMKFLLLNSPSVKGKVSREEADKLMATSTVSIIPKILRNNSIDHPIKREVFINHGMLQNSNSFKLNLRLSKILAVLLIYIKKARI